MKGYNDKLLELYYPLGVSSLDQLSLTYKQSNLNFPSELAKLVFKKVAHCILLLGEQNFYHTDIKPSNIVLSNHSGELDH